jgi:RNA polymerase sigma factor (TIGR02999 family)
MDAEGLGWTSLLQAAAAGDDCAVAQLLARSYDELRWMARLQLRRGRPGGLETTVLVHEVFLKLVRSARVDAADHSHFLAIVGRAMRQIVVDEARAEAAEKRGGPNVPATLVTGLHLLAQGQSSVLRVHHALERLELVEPMLARLVELRVFAGLSETETATALGLSLRSQQRAWQRARGWLRVALADSP